MDKCNDHETCMKEHRDSIKNIEQTVNRMDGLITGYISATRHFIESSEKTMHDSDSGIIVKLANSCLQVKLQWLLLSGLLLAVIVDFFKK